MTSVGFVLSKAMRSRVRRRLLLAIGRFGPGIEDVTIRLSESRNPMGGVDRRCLVRASLRSDLVVQAEATSGEIEEAVGRSSLRLARLVSAALAGG